MNENPCHHISDKTDTPVCGSDGITYPSICHFNWYKRYCKFNNEIKSAVFNPDLKMNNKNSSQMKKNNNGNLTVVKFSEC